MRLLLGICALSEEAITFTTTDPESLGRRPNADLLDALSQLGVDIISSSQAGTLPITLRKANLHGGAVKISGSKSSQYLSALLFLGPLLAEGLDIEVIDDLTSASFIDLTIQLLATAGITIHTLEQYRRYHIVGQQHYQSGTYNVPGDYPSAAALLGAVAVTGGEITLLNLPANDPGGISVLNAFTRLGLEITRHGEDIVAHARGPLQGINLDGNQVIDSVPVITAAACFASTPSNITNVANLHLKESDRIQDLASELQKIGAQVIPLADALEIYPIERSKLLGGQDVDAHADHRLIQALAIAALGSRQPVTIQHARHIAKSYPHFFDDLTKLGAKVVAH